ncbi:rhodanese-related sulfurtransferase [Oscillatoria sp. FACHB-1407]|uniref:rhodanese-like domain-containing protein n=1 Tax=Oscillatoria sp. FACHB-1407 TaxID=2692847 RepID=UPI001686980E|nr:rhodanese-like domain-containing protein [Oscillatoria sp. FACHB-1407]MBD2462738.1 rhodanese-related sulfurtransferase [Oscillatoria sp. FACHB-1407]
MSAHTFNQPIPQIDVDTFAAHRADTQEPLQLVDVREPEELAIASVDGFVSLPLSQFGEWSGKINTILDPTVETIVMCHHGMRSAQMCQWLMNQGFTNVKNLAGGIDAYADVVDSSVPRY